jgi:two-component sensor histidine kinase
LQVLMALIDLQSANTSSEEGLAGLSALKRRIHIMALVHEKLYRSRDLTHIHMDDYLSNLVGYLRESLMAGERITIELEVEDIILDVEHANPCGMVVSELVTNAIKHAFPAGCVPPEGCRIKVSFTHHEGEYRLCVCDNGAGLPPGWDWRSGSSLGLKLIDLMGSQQLEGDVQVESAPGQGTSFTLCFKC